MLQYFTNSHIYCIKPSASDLLEWEKIGYGGCSGSFQIPTVLDSGNI